MSATCVKYCIIIICGLPGVGKTTFTSKLVSFLASHKELKCIHLEYDKFEQQEKQKTNPQTEVAIDNHENIPYDSSAWKSARERVEQLVEGLLSGSLSTATLCNSYLNQVFESEKTQFIFLDDNMYYHSMRFSFFKLCQKYNAGFVQLYLKAPVEYAIHNDQQRPAHVQVGSYVIQQMQCKLEEPDATKNAWEKHTITIDATKLDISNDAVFHKLFNDITLFAQDPLPEVPIEDEEEKERSRIANYESVVHQFDLRSRKLLASLIPKNSPKAGIVASKLNQKRKDFLQTLKTSPNKFKSYSLEDMESLFVEESNKIVAESS